MIAELGNACLIFALLVAIFQFQYVFPWQSRSYTAACQRQAAWLQTLLITLSFASLIILRIESDFSVANVAQHSNLHLPLLYKIVGTWGNHEGSMLLWVWVLSVFGALIAFSTIRDNELVNTTIAVQAFLSAGAILFILATSNPFDRIFPPALDGKALNPLLQDIGLALHPPLLYLGYVGFSIVFSFAVASLLLQRSGSEWASIVHPWILGAWSALTAGIGLGSWWAYRELGWGGWWFWDPVENASLLPWLSGTALLHANITLKKRNALSQWVFVLSIMTFALSMIGTFLVRSGVLTSVHSFASDPERGTYILVYIIVTVGGALLLFAFRGDRVKSAEAVAPASREGMIMINNLFFITACLSVLLGTLYPLIAEAIHGYKLTVGAPYFNLTFIPLMILPIFFAGIAPLVPWRQAKFSRLLRQLQYPAIALLAACFVVLATAETDIAYAMLGFGLAAWLAVSSLVLIRKYALKRSAPVAVSHFGVALLVIGITGVGLWKAEAEKWLKPGESLKLNGYSLNYVRKTVTEGKNYHTKIADLRLLYDDKELALLKPEYRHYQIAGSYTNEVAIHPHLSGDLYAVIGEDSTDGSRLSVRLYYIPMINFIWAGFICIAIGGLLSIILQKKGKSGDVTL